MGFGKTPIAVHSFRLHMTIYGDVPDSNWCTLQVDGGWNYISSTTPQATIEYLRVTFVRFEAVVTDKGTCFNSRVYQV